jgi:hypothetical protein
MGAIGGRRQAQVGDVVIGLYPGGIGFVVVLTASVLVALLCSWEW